MEPDKYCRECGGMIPASSAFCSQCGAAQYEELRRRSHMSSFWVALALVLFPPLGFILMWTSTDWDSDVKWAISGIFFPPLWLRFLWKIPWLPYAIGLLLAAITLQAAVFGGFSPAATVAILGTIGVILMFTLGTQFPRGRRQPQLSPRQTRVVEEKLNACDALIAEIESDLSLELLPVTSPQRRRYARALEMRAEGNDLFRRAEDMRELAGAEGRITGALRELRSIREGITRDDTV